VGDREGDKMFGGGPWDVSGMGATVSFVPGAWKLLRRE
jgi:hypothetical protein